MLRLCLRDRKEVNDLNLIASVQKELIKGKVIRGCLNYDKLKKIQIIGFLQWNVFIGPPGMATKFFSLTASISGPCFENITC